VKERDLTPIELLSFFFCLALSTTTAINHGISLMLSQNDDTDCGVENITSDWPKLTGRRLLN
jgi:hypothetical protein